MRFWAQNGENPVLKVAQTGPKQAQTRPNEAQTVHKVAQRGPNVAHLWPKMVPHRHMSLTCVYSTVL